MKRKALCLVICAALLLILTAGLLVACNHGGGEYAVTFKDGTATISTVKVASGKQLNANDIPAGPLHDGEDFVGWFVEDEQIAGGYVPTKSVTALAKYQPATVYYIVTFMVGDEVFDEVQVAAGGKLAQLPTPTAEDGYTFVGWFDGEAQLTVDTVINADAQYAARFDLIGNRVVFKAKDIVVKEVYVPVGGALTAADIPDFYAVPGEIFMGWYAGEVKAEAGLAIDSECEFTAYVFSRSAYNGEWVDAEKRLMVKINDETVTVCDKDSTPVDNGELQLNLTDSAYTMIGGKEFPLQTGSLSYNNYDECWSFYLTSSGTIKGLYVAYDTDAADRDDEGYVTRNYNFVRCESGSFVAGKYAYRSTDDVTVLDNGVVTSVNDTPVIYGYFYKQNSGYVLEYMWIAASYSFNVTVDEQGNLWMGSKLYVKCDQAPYEYADASGKTTLRQFICDKEEVYVVEVEGVCYYAQIEGSLKDPSFFVTFNGVTRSAKISGVEFVLSEGDFGTFEGADGTLVFDGFGGGTLAGSRISYTFNPLSKLCYVGGKVYRLDFENGVYTVVAAADQLEGAKYRYDYASSMYIVVTFDGFGRISLVDRSDSMVFDNYSGYYNFEDDTIEFSSNCDKLPNGVYAIIYDGNVFQQGIAMLVKEGYQLHNSVDDFLGYWLGDGKDYVYIYYDIYVKYYYMSVPGEYVPVKLKSAADGSILEGVEDECTVTMDGDRLKVEYKNQTKYYTYYGEFAPFAGFDSLYIGSWTTGDGMRFEIGATSLTIDGEAVTRLHENDYYEYEFTYQNADYVLRSDVYNQIIFAEAGALGRKKLLYSVPAAQVAIGAPFVGDYLGSYNGTDILLSVSASGITLNGVAPTHINVLGENEHGDYSSLSFYMESGEFAGQDVQLYVGSDVSIRLVGDENDVGLVSALSMFNGKYTHEEEWISFDGNGNAVYFDGSQRSAKYTVEDGKARFEIGAQSFVCEKQDNLHLSVSVTGDGDRTVVFETAVEAWMTTFSGTQIDNGWHWSFTFNVDGTVSAVCEERDSYNETAAYTVSQRDGKTIIEFRLGNFYEDFVCMVDGNDLYVTSSVGSESSSFYNSKFTKA